MTDGTENANSGSRILAVANQKGGVGKTTTAINVCTGLAQAGKTCLLIDLDPQGNASTGLGISGQDRGTTIYDVLSESATMSQAIQDTSVSGLALCPSAMELSGLDAELMDESDRVFRLRGALQDFLKPGEFDLVVIDCPPSLSLLTVNALAAADMVIVPLQCEFFALEGLSQLLSTIKRVQNGINPHLRLHGIVLTMFDRRNRLSFQVEQDVRENLGDIVYSTVIPRNVRLSEAPSFALPALIYDETCSGSRAYRALVDEILERETAARAA